MRLNTSVRPWMLVLVLALAMLASDGMTAETKTSKERLSDKAADEQRVDNCRVPAERRGAVARPDCGGAATAPPDAAGKAREDEPKQGR